MRILFSLFLLIAALPVHADEAVHWDYQGTTSPEHWGQLSPEFRLCTTGKNQTPINIQSTFKSSLPPLQLDFTARKQTIVNNGHTIQIDVSSGNMLKLDGRTFELQQFHFHNPSENQIHGKSFPMEAHFVYKDKNSELAVLALMMEEGATNGQLTHAWQAMPKRIGGSVELKTPVDIRSLLPKNLAYYRFNGSLTTPPCSEGVRWLILKNPVTASKPQIDQFAAEMRHHNNRPVQPLYGRLVIE